MRNTKRGKATPEILKNNGEILIFENSLPIYEFFKIEDTFTSIYEKGRKAKRRQILNRAAFAT